MRIVFSRALLMTLSLAAVMVLPQGILASVTSIQDATSGQEPDLSGILDTVAPLAGGWGDTDDLNHNANGRRVPDRADIQDGICDQAWFGDDVKVTALTLFWGGGSSPCDDLYGGKPAQKLVWTDNLAGANPRNPDTGTVDLNHRLGEFDLGQLGLNQTIEFRIGDLRGGTSPAWSQEALNASWSYRVSGGTQTSRDRMVTFDVSGLDIYEWLSGSKPKANSGKKLIRSADQPGPAYILGFDAGSDGDFQDMVVLIEGANVTPFMIPEPTTLGLLAAGGLVCLARKRKAARI